MRACRILGIANEQAAFETIEILEEYVIIWDNTPSDPSSKCHMFT